MMIYTPRMEHNSNLFGDASFLAVARFASAGRYARSAASCMLSYWLDEVRSM